MGVVLVYAGLLTTVVGLATLASPRWRLGIATRPRATVVLLLGLTMSLGGVILPAPVHRSGGSPSHLIERFMPEYHFNEVHSVRIQSPPDRIFRAIHAVTPDEVRGAYVLLWIRSIPARLTGRTVRSSRTPRPILEPEPTLGKVVLGEKPDQEILLGIVGPFWKPAGGRPPQIGGPREFLAFDDPEHAKATMGFWLEDEGGGWFRLTTETRVFTPHSSTRRRFAAYWRLIYPGSALLRRDPARDRRRRPAGRLAAD
jgi:hypothetical protein